MVKIRYTIVLYVLFQSCIPRNDLKHFTLYNSNPSNIGNIKLKMNGIYAIKTERNIKYSPEDPDVYLDYSFILYGNGNYRNLYSIPFNYKDNLDSVLLERVKYYKTKKYLSIKDKLGWINWGRYQIKNDTIIIQDFMQCNRPWIYVVREQKGKILNDSTIVINSMRLCARNTKTSMKCITSIKPIKNQIP